MQVFAMLMLASRVDWAILHKVTKACLNVEYSPWGELPSTAHGVSYPASRLWGEIYSPKPSRRPSGRQEYRRTQAGDLDQCAV